MVVFSGGVRGEEGGKRNTKETGYNLQNCVAQGVTSLLWVSDSLSLLLSYSVRSNSSATPWTVACQAPLSIGFPR